MNNSEIQIYKAEDGKTEIQDYSSDQIRSLFRDDERYTIGI